MSELTDEEFWSLIEPRCMLSGFGEKYRLAFEHLLTIRSELRITYCTMCVAFSEKPMDFMITGTTRYGKGNLGILSDKILKLCPKLPELSRSDMGSRRLKLPEAWRMVNFSSIHNTALLFLEACSKFEVFPNDVVVQWFAIHNNLPPSQFTIDQWNGKLLLKQTEEIKVTRFALFKADSNYWPDHVDKFENVLANVSTNMTPKRTRKEEISSSNKSVEIRTKSK